MDPFRITLVEKNGTNMIEPHFHNTYELFFLIEGTRAFFIKDQTYTINPKTLVFLNPKVIHRTLVKDNPYFKRYVMMIPKEFIGSLALSYEGNLFDCFNRENPLLVLNDSQYKEILLLFEKIHKTYSDNESTNQFILSLMVTQLLYYINQFLKNHQPPQLSSFKATVSYEVIQILAAKYPEKITLEMLSKDLFISTYQLCRIFKSETGFTIMEYLTQLRIREAMRLLDTSEDTITEIGFKVGFNNTIHFIRTFRQRFGTTPKQYQLKKRQ